MKNLFEEAGIRISEEKLDLFGVYLDFLLTYNEKVNLTAITERDEVIKKHFVDSVTGVDKICGKTAIDVGSGGGFPAVPLKIMREDIDFTLVESTGKKCEFLSLLVEKLGIKGINVVCARAEDIGKDEKFREKFDCVTARAVARLNTLAEYCMPLLKVGGRFISYKGDPDEELKDGERAINILGGRIEEVKRFTLFGAKRALIVAKKEKHTDKKYPRGKGKERKQPL